MKHEPKIQSVVKMDMPVGLHRGGCSCGWLAGGIESENGAWKSARQHADAKNREN